MKKSRFTDQQVAFGLQPGRVLKMRRARRRAPLLRLRVAAIPGDDQPLHVGLLSATLTWFMSV